MLENSIDNTVESTVCIQCTVKSQEMFFYVLPTPTIARPQDYSVFVWLLVIGWH